MRHREYTIHEPLKPRCEQSTGRQPTGRATGPLASTFPANPQASKSVFRALRAALRRHSRQTDPKTSMGSPNGGSACHGPWQHRDFAQVLASGVPNPQRQTLI